MVAAVSCIASTMRLLWRFRGGFVLGGVAATLFSAVMLGSVFSFIEAYSLYGLTGEVIVRAQGLMLFYAIFTLPLGILLTIVLGAPVFILLERYRIRSLMAYAASGYALLAIILTISAWDLGLETLLLPLTGSVAAAVFYLKSAQELFDMDFEGRPQ
ncbi:hypothetical protein [Ferrovibrio terrae]|uniref:hypothetical protein n=1 Tax=Ferrovibrio terrae TaxID=2594003 RepID=UPI0031380C0D